MSIDAISFAFAQRPPSPLMKLILIAAGDQVDERTGLWRPDLQWLARFCCVQQDGVEAAIAEMLRVGILIGQDDPSVFAIAGYEPPSIVADPNRYTKRIISVKLRRQVYARDGNACRICGAVENLSVDHIHPERHGGTLDLDNLQTLCRPCNSRKGSRVA